MNTIPTGIQGCIDPGVIRRTYDGSDTIWSEHFQEHYHSIHGAIRESSYIFIEQGMMAVPPVEETLKVFEVGFGTGLNCLLTALTSLNLLVPVEYTSIELYPLSDTVWPLLNYPEAIGGEETSTLFRQIHQLSWNRTSLINPLFTVNKIHGDILLLKPETKGYDIVYFDAFSPAIQPEMWSVSQFEKLSPLLKSGGVLITYSCQGQVKRNLRQAGFTVEKLPGPPGKREILRARNRQ